jgi:hypothetical protein
VLQKRPVGLSADVPNNREPSDDLVSLGGLTMVITVFLALVGQGCPPREALTVTIGLGLGGAEVVRHLRRGRDGDSGDRR